MSSEPPPIRRYSARSSTSFVLSSPSQLCPITHRRLRAFITSGQSDCYLPGTQHDTTETHYNHPPAATPLTLFPTCHLPCGGNKQDSPYPSYVQSVPSALSNSSIYPPRHFPSPSRPSAHYPDACYRLRASGCLPIGGSGRNRQTGRLCKGHPRGKGRPRIRARSGWIRLGGLAGCQQVVRAVSREKGWVRWRWKVGSVGSTRAARKRDFKVGIEGLNVRESF